MSQKLSLVVAVSKFLGLSPLGKVNFFQKVYSLFVVTILSATIAFSSIDRGYLKSYNHIKTIISILMDVIAYFFDCYTILWTTFRHQKQWLGLVEADRRGDYDCLVFVILNAIFWVVMVSSNYAFTQIVVFKTVQDVIVVDVELYTQFLYGYLIYVTADQLQTKFCYLRHNLEEFVSNNRVKSTGNDFFFTMKKFEHLAYGLKQNVDDFNDIFGVPLLLTISYATLHFVNYIDDLFFFRFAPEKIFQFCISNVSLVAMIFLGNCLLIVKCDKILTEARGVINVAYRLKKMYPCVLSGERVEANEFVNFLIQSYPKLSASGFFEIRKATILSILGTVTTLLIVMIQFDSNK